jgi:hypothetical protein
MISRRIDKVNARLLIRTAYKITKNSLMEPINQSILRRQRIPVVSKVALLGDGSYDYRQ